MTVDSSLAVDKPTILPDKCVPNETVLFSDPMLVHIHQAIAACDVRKQEMAGKELIEVTNMLNEKEKSAPVIKAGELDELERLVMKLLSLLQSKTVLSLLLAYSCFRSFVYIYILKPN